MSEAFITLLQQHGALEWFRFLGSRDDGLMLPPLVVWRFAKEEASLGAKVQEAVATFDGEVAWVCERPGRNWILVPARVIEIQRERELATDTEALTLIAGESPAFSAEANEELKALVDHVARALGPSAT